MRSSRLGFAPQVDDLPVVSRQTVQTIFILLVINMNRSTCISRARPQKGRQLLYHLLTWADTQLQCYWVDMSFLSTLWALAATSYRIDLKCSVHMLGSNSIPLLSTRCEIGKPRCDFDAYDGERQRLVIGVNDSIASLQHVLEMFYAAVNGE